MEPQPFTVNVPDATLADLQERLARVRWPDAPPGAGWDYGTDVAYLRELVAYWRDGYDWRAHEARLNAFAQSTVPLAGIDLHFVHQPGVGPDPLPLLLSHGWPGSVWEFHKVIPMLTDPARFGGDPADAFTVVAPSLPGYGFSFRPGQPRFGVGAIADAFAALMTDVLGYRRFVAQGGDWGSLISARLALGYPERVPAIHLNFLLLPADTGTPAAPTPEEEQYAARPGTLAGRGDGLRGDPGDQAADARLRTDRLAGRAGGLDRREVPRLERLRRRRRARLRARTSC